MLDFQAARFCLVTVDGVRPTGWGSTQHIGPGKTPTGCGVGRPGWRGSCVLSGPRHEMRVMGMMMVGVVSCSAPGYFHAEKRFVFL